MKSSIATVSVGGTLDQKLEAIARAGFDAVEIFENDLLSSPHSAADIGAIMRNLGLDCAMLQPFRDYEGMAADVRDRSLERMRRKFGVMDDLGTDLILLCSNCSPQASADRQQQLDDLHQLGELAAAHGKRIAYEALAWGTHVYDHRDAWGLVRDVDHPAIGLTLDSFHSLARRVPTSSIGDIRPDKLFIVQWADAPVLEMDYLNWSRHFRCMPGQGDFALEEYAAALRKIGYQGYWSLEIFNDRFRATLPSQIALDGRRSLKALHDRAGRKLGLGGDLPAPVAPRNCEFIEIAASHAEAAEFEQMLGGLGFAAVARHRSKDVTRWVQGGINVVINSEPEGLAHSFDIVHGGSVCAIGLAVEDPQQVLDRSAALDVARYVQKVKPDEWAIPSVRGVGGSLIYLVDAKTSQQMWAEEFPLALPGQPQAHLTRLDHLAQTMHHEEFLSWLLYYTTLFDMTKTPQLEIADAMGIVYSQAVETPDRGLRITLNGSLSANALSSRFVQAYFGAGVQHVAFATGDVFAAARGARDAGTPILQIGPNYYEDLEARHGLDPALVAQMAELNILYDRDGEAEYFQFYTRAIAKRMFFEVVERRGYEAYGAANATIRLNAQAIHRDPAGL